MSHTLTGVRAEKPNRGRGLCTVIREKIVVNLEDIVKKMIQGRVMSSTVRKKKR